MYVNGMLLCKWSINQVQHCYQQREIIQTVEHLQNYNLVVLKLLRKQLIQQTRLLNLPVVWAYPLNVYRAAAEANHLPVANFVFKNFVRQSF